MPRVALCVLVLCVLSSAASAQVLFEPIQHQYTAGGTTYYYGGSDPRIHAYAAEPYSPAGTWGRAHGYAFFSGDVRKHREVANEPTHVFTDSLGFINAHIAGVTPTDAYNEANANAPRYFVKRHLLNTAVARHGYWTVSAHAQPVRVFKSTGEEVRQPATMPRPLMIIPKDSLKRPMPKAAASDKQLVLAD